MSGSAFAEVAFLSYCDVSYAGARACVEALEWHKTRGHEVVSESFGILTESARPSVAHPQSPSINDSISTVSVGGRRIASYAIVHCPLLLSHAAANAAAIARALAQRGARRIFLVSAVHQPIFDGIRCQVLARKPAQFPFLR